MAITLRSSREIEMLRKAGAVVAKVLSKLQEAVKAGSQYRLNWTDCAGQMTDEAGATALFQGRAVPVCDRCRFPA